MKQRFDAGLPEAGQLTRGLDSGLKIIQTDFQSFHPEGVLMSKVFRRRATLRAAAVGIAAAVLLSTGISTATPAAAVSYCPEYNHIGPCTTAEMIAINFNYYIRLYNAGVAMQKAIADAVRGIVRRS